MKMNLATKKTIALRLAPLLLLGACSDMGSSSGSIKGGPTLGMAVVSSDYQSSSISLVDPGSGALATDRCLHSGSTTSVLSMPLSGDVALPTQAQPDNELVIIDRTNSALVWVDPTTCEVRRQASVGTGFYANPHDVVAVSPQKAYVTRFERNPRPADENGLDRGEDLLVLEPGTGAITGRVDLGPLATGAEQVLARPDRALLGGGRVFVSLNEQSEDFMITGPGRVAMIDPVTDAILSRIEIPDFRNCGGLDYVASAGLLLVSCGGDYNAADQTAQSALLVFDAIATNPVLKKTIPARTISDKPFSGTVAALSERYAIMITSGDFSGTPPDALWLVDLDSGLGTQVYTAGGAFVLGGANVDVERRRLYVTDASAGAPKILVFDTSGLPAVTPAGSFEASPGSGLPPRAIAWY